MIEVKEITKSFKVKKRNPGVLSALKMLVKPEYTTVQALNNLSFSIGEGEIVGYIGPNGAGKSTTIKIISGILVPDSGECRILGFTPWKNRKEYVKNIGVVFGQRTQLWWDVPVADSYNLLKDIYKVPDAVFRNNLELLTETLSIKELLNTPARQLSLGQRMRCELGASLLHDPKILFLDEPTIGLDAVSKLSVRHFIKTVNEEKKLTVILTTHDMFDIEALALRIILIGKGEKLYDGSLANLKSRFETHKIISVDYEGKRNLPDIHGTAIIKESEGRVELSVDTSVNKISDVVSHLSQMLEIVDITVESRPVDEIIADLYKEYNL